MDALQEAKRLIEGAYYDERNMADVMRKDAAVYAAIAQAEAMQLIVKRLEQWMDAQGVGVEMMEAAERGVYYAKENEELRRRIALLEDDSNEALDDYKYRKAQAEAWAKAERGE